MNVYFDFTPRDCEEVKEMKPVERAISIAEYCGKYNCILPTKEVGVSIGWCLECDGKEYRLSKNNELVFRCYDRAYIERYLCENVFVEVLKS